jgi:hypothetical protein
MASQVIVNTSTSSLEVVEIHSYVRGYHAYMDVWENPEQGQGMLLKREPGKSKDQHAVAVLREGEIVGHVPYNLAPAVSHFLRRDMNKAFAEVTGGKVNRGAGYGLEVPCIYRLLYGPKAYIDRMKELVENLPSGHV